MITDKTLVYGTNVDPRLIVRLGVALTQATKDNVYRLMTNLEQPKRNAAQLKETLKKERDEGHKLKRKFEDMQNEVRTSKTELHTLQANKEALEIFAGKMEKDAQNSLAKLQRLQLEHQVLKFEKDNLQVSYETLSAEKFQLQKRVIELESEKATTEEKEKQYQMQVAVLEG